jgi:beta-lactamase regulating signal transducer with metallopeptidase domain
MNLLIADLAGTVPSVLVQVTVLCAAGLVVQLMVKRSPAGRYAVLFWTLIAAGLCAPLTLAIQRSGMHMPIASTLQELPMKSVLEPSGPPPSPATGHPGPVKQAWSPAPLRVLAWTWAAGSLLGLLRTARGLYLVRRLRQQATAPAANERMNQVLRRLSKYLGGEAPTVLISDRVSTPMAAGYLNPVILLPRQVPELLDDQQLLSVLIHESAHIIRRDGIAGLYQRTLAALFWFHPLIHLVNHLLDRAREEVCDNHVLLATAPPEYSRTLVLIAEKLSPFSGGWHSPTLIRPATSLERRISGLLNSRRCTVTRMTSWKAVVIAAGFVAGAFVLSSLAAARTGELDLAGNISQAVPFVVGTTHLSGGDNITIEEIHGTSDTFAAGNVYEIKGTYKLASHEKAALAVSITTDIGYPARHVPIAGVQRSQGTNKVIVEKGEGHFRLLMFMADEGSPHLSFYPLPGGESFAIVNFAHRQYSAEDMSHRVRFAIDRTQFEEGDSITIDEIRGTADTIAEGNVYEITGFYKLTSQPKAILSTSFHRPASGTARSRGLDDTQGPRKMDVERGEGRFRLILYMREEGTPRLSFYGGGHAFAKVDFGNQ